LSVAFGFNVPIKGLNKGVGWQWRMSDGQFGRVAADGGRYLDECDAGRLSRLCHVVLWDD